MRSWEEFSQFFLINEVPALTQSGQYIIRKKEYFMHFFNHEPGHIMMEVSKKSGLHPVLILLKPAIFQWPLCRGRKYHSLMFVQRNTQEAQGRDEIWKTLSSTPLSNST